MNELEYQALWEQAVARRDAATDDVVRASYDQAAQAYRTALLLLRHSDRTAEAADQQRRSASHFQAELPQATVTTNDGRVIPTHQALAETADGLEAAAEVAEEKAVEQYELGQELDSYAASQIEV